MVDMDSKVFKIYENAKMHMKNTPDDWAKVIRCFEKIYKRELNADIQEAINLLEENCREGEL